MTYHDLLEALRRAVRMHADRHGNSEGLALTPVPGLRMMRSFAPTGPMRSVYRPLVCLVLQGAKRLTVAGNEQQFSGGQSVIVAVDSPVLGQIIEASRSAPYLAVAIELDMAVMHAVAIESGPPGKARRISSTLFVDSLDDTILNCAVRLMRLIDHPEAVPVVRDAVLRELYYWLLASPHGAALRGLCLPNSHADRISRAIDILRADFREPIEVAKLAGAAGLSLTAFRRHFRGITSISPNQFQKQLRLVEARRLMLSEGTQASQAAYEVGYQSASQFSRDYARLFGAPPREHLRRGMDMSG
jgi:AraC-like DNA-binding protein